MNCPQCGGEYSIITSTLTRGARVYRRRLCPACRSEFRSTELTDAELRKLEQADIRATARFHAGRIRAVAEGRVG